MVSVFIILLIFMLFVLTSYGFCIARELRLSREILSVGKKIDIELNKQK